MERVANGPAANSRMIRTQSFGRSIWIACMVSGSTMSLAPAWQSSARVRMPGPSGQESDAVVALGVGAQAVGKGCWSVGGGNAWGEDNPISV